MARKLVLVVDGYPPVRAVIRAIFEDDPSIDFVEAASAQESLDQVHQHRPDVILLDTELPDLDGLDLCRRLKADPVTRSIPVILMTHEWWLPGRQVLAEAGVDDSIRKPFQIDHLMAKVHAALGARRAVERAEPDAPPSGAIPLWLAVEDAAAPADSNGVMH
ncbi:MAG: response regulator [Chloroflexi bacterium]|nr:response regulator [Chloroflexota bacterium]